MQTNTGGLDEVVGYGTQKRENLTGVSSMKFDGSFENIPITDVSQALSGKMFGV